jgi:APA family basic amino acid/polyamine antiporter
MESVRYHEPVDDLSRELGLLDAVAVVVGTIIGSGIFLVPNLVARQLPSTPMILAVWIFSGVLSFCGALAYAELGAMMPETGGQYVYLREAYGALVAFLCGWSYFFVVISGAVAWLGISFALYLSYFIPLSTGPARIVAVALITLVTAVNYRGIAAGAAVQKIFMFLKVAGLAILIGAAFLHPAPDAHIEAAAVTPTQFGAAMIACLLSYDGWVAISFIAGEVRNPQRNIPLALCLGLGAAILIYVLANAAYLRVLSPVEVAGADRVGALVAERAIGSRGAAIVSLIVMISIVGSANGWTMTGPRIYFAQARNALFFQRFGDVHPLYHTPWISIVMQGLWAAALAVTGTYESLAAYAMFAAWLFYGLTALGVLVLRRKAPSRPRPYRMWGYPITLVLFVIVAFGFVLNTIVATPVPAITGTLLIATGIPAYFLWRRRLLR